MNHNFPNEYTEHFTGDEDAISFSDLEDSYVLSNQENEVFDRPVRNKRKNPFLEDIGEERRTAEPDLIETVMDRKKKKDQENSFVDNYVSENPVMNRFSRFQKQKAPKNNELNSADYSAMMSAVNFLQELGKITLSQGKSEVSFEFEKSEDNDEILSVKVKDPSSEVTSEIEPVKEEIKEEQNDPEEAQFEALVQEERKETVQKFLEAITALKDKKVQRKARHSKDDKTTARFEFSKGLSYNEMMDRFNATASGESEKNRHPSESKEEIRQYLENLLHEEMKLQGIEEIVFENEFSGIDLKTLIEKRRGLPSERKKKEVKKEIVEPVLRNKGIDMMQDEVGEQLLKDFF